MFTATIAAPAGTVGGTVTFSDGATTLGTGTVVGTQATFATANLPAGTHAVTAAYAGNATTAASTSAALSQVVNGSTVYVDKANPACKTTGVGAGSAATPWCTINGAAAKSAAGQTIVVAPGTYSERVVVAGTGTGAAPITFVPATPGTVTVTGGSNGFSVTSKAYVVIRGFIVTGTTGPGIVATTSNNITIDGNHVSNAGQPVNGLTANGIKLSGTTSSVVLNNVTDHNSDAGVLVTTSADNNQIHHNTSFANARGYVRAAAGFDLRNSTGNSVFDNVSHDNEDSGFNMWTGTTFGSNSAYDNVAYNNGDHGIDVHNAVDARIIANTVYGNYDSGIEMTTSTGTLVANNVSVDNGINSARTSGEIRVDGPSVATTTLNDDLVWLRTPGVMFDFNGVKYASLAAFRAATGQESRGIEGDPRFVSVAGADFHLLAGSPAIDAANTGAAGQPGVDFDGNGRFDDPATPNTGVGPVGYADRGAFEFRG
jgi:parallel beta-helix repeat protein